MHNQAMDREDVADRATGPVVTDPADQADPARCGDPAPPDGPVRPGRWARARGAIRDHLAFALVLLVATVGVVRMLEYHWRQGAALIGGALLVAALFRAVLPDRRAGLLLVRGRPVDVLSYAGLGVCVLSVAITIQGGPLG